MLEKILYVLLAIAIMLLMVVVHELGHYTAGKLLKFKINEFSVGFGPKLLQKKRKNGELVTLRLVPLGGYCSFLGEEDIEPQNVNENKPIDVFNETKVETIEPTSEIAINNNVATAKQSEELTFNQQKPWKRLIVFVAGAGFNLISAILFSFIFLLIIGYATPKISEVYLDGDAPYNNFIKGDQVIEVDGKKITVLNTFEELVQNKKVGDKATFKVIRDGQEIDIIVTKQKITTTEATYDGFGMLTERVYKNGNLGTALVYCVPYTFKLSWLILGTFGKLVTGQIPLTSLAGPIGTIDQISSLSMDNWRNILVLLPLIASNLAIFNLLPIPALDGSKVVFTVIEWIRKKPINRKVENIIHVVGLFALFGFVILIDIIGMFMR